MVSSTGFEPVTIRLEGGCSIQLSYEDIKKLDDHDLRIYEDFTTLFRMYGKSIHLLSNIYALFFQIFFQMSISFNFSLHYSRSVL